MIASDRPQYGVGRVKARSALAKKTRGISSPMVGVFVHGKQVGHITDDAPNALFITRDIEKRVERDLTEWVRSQLQNEEIMSISLPPLPQQKRASLTDI